MYKRTNDSYTDNNGNVVKDPKLLEYFTSLRIPPAWTNVTIFAKGAQTCCGFDAKGRMQCLYSQSHIEKAKKRKFCDLVAFGEALPAIESTIRASLKSQKYTKNKIISIILSIVQSCGFRLGNLTYEDDNDHYGITTIKRSHVKFEDKVAEISFIGKKGVLNACIVKDHAIVQMLKELVSVNTGDDHVMVYNNAGYHHIKHTDVNNFLKDFHPSITSKDFRVFKANVLLIEMLPIESTNRKKDLLEVIKKIADMIHNTPAVCKKDYILDILIDLYLEHPIKYKKMFNNDTSARVKFLNFLRLNC